MGSACVGGVTHAASLAQGCTTVHNAPKTMGFWLNLGLSLHDITHTESEVESG